MLHGIREGVIGFDAKGCVNLVNDEARRLLPVQSVVPGQHLDELIPAGRLHDLLSGKVPGSDHLVLTDEYLLILNWREVTLGGRSAGSVVTLRDRTELESLVRELDTVNGLTAALRAQEHEFANRLHVITGLLELGDTAEATSYLADISTRSLAQAEELRSRISPPAVAALLLAKIAISTERGIDFDVTPESRLDQPYSATRTLLTVIGNLVDNAFDALDGCPDRRRVTLELSDQGGEVSIVVTDTGPGIAADTVDEIFQDGFTTKTARGRLRRGLGLALVDGARRLAAGPVDARAGGGNGRSTGQRMRPLRRGGKAVDRAAPQPGQGCPGRDRTRGGRAREGRDAVLRPVLDGDVQAAVDGRRGRAFPHEHDGFPKTSRTVWPRATAWCALCRTARNWDVAGLWLVRHRNAPSPPLPSG